MDGGTEKEGINIAPPFLPTKMDSPARFNSKTQKSFISVDNCYETGKEGASMRVNSLGKNSGLEPIKQDQLEGEDPFLAKLQEIDRNLGSLKENRTSTMVGELSNNILLTSHLNPIGILIWGARLVEWWPFSNWQNVLGLIELVPKDMSLPFLGRT